MFFMKELKSAFLFQNHRPGQGVAQGIRAPSIKMPLMTKGLVFSFSVSFNVFAYNSTRLQQ